MPVVTLEGYLGSGYQNIGKKVSEKLEIDFVDRVILSDILIDSCAKLKTYIICLNFRF